MSHFAALTLAATLLAGSIVSAAAQDRAQETPEKEGNALTTLLPHQQGRALCYVSRGAPVTFPLEDIPARTKPRHLTVRRFLFELKSEKFDDDDTTASPTPGKAYYGYTLLAEVKGRKARLVATGTCESGSMAGFSCGVECDGGVMHFEPLTRTGSVKMRIAEGIHRFRMSWGCGAGKSEVLHDEPGTPAIRLDRAGAKRCAPIRRESEERERRRG